MNAAVNQRTPSKWMALSMAQSALFLFALPIACRRRWDALFGSLSNEAAECLLNFAGVVGCYGAYTVAMLPVYWMQHPFFERFKIRNDRPWPWLDERRRVRDEFWALSLRSARLTFVNLFVLLPLMSAVKVWLSKITGTDDPNAFSTGDDHWPTPGKNLRDLFHLVVIHEFGFYTTHRMMHAYPFLYRFHKVHHEWKQSTTLAAQHNHP